MIYFDEDYILDDCSLTFWIGCSAVVMLKVFRSSLGNWAVEREKSIEYPLEVDKILFFVHSQAKRLFEMIPVERVTHLEGVDRKLQAHPVTTSSIADSSLHSA